MSDTQPIKRKMNMKKLGILFLLIPFIITILIILLFVFVVDSLGAVGDLLFYLLLFGSPIFIGMGIFFLIKSSDKHKGIFSNNVSKRRKIIGKVILFGVIAPIFLLLIGSFVYMQISYYINAELSKKYRENCPVYVAGEEEDEILEPTLIGTYEFKPDEYVWRWSTEDMGYYYQDILIDNPQQYIPKQVYTVKESWLLKNNYKLDLNCTPIDFTKVETGQSHKCTISYNEKVISTDVRHEVHCYYEESKSCTNSLGVTLYSNRYSSGNAEYLFLLSHAGDSHNKLSAFRLEDGEFFPLMFKYEDRGENISSQTFLISDTIFELYGIEKYGMFDFMMDGDMNLVTFFSEPTMGYTNNIYGIHSIWNVEKDGLYLKKTVMELTENWEAEVEDGI
ncbi:MAG: hypothetical protein RBS01_03895 [Candidatus Dojkabacteria bacterium]|jgi:hypothetical protein|nr:hypothetical protein [Candidatus Dojkabacteria bacterium]